MPKAVLIGSGSDIGGTLVTCLKMDGWEIATYPGRSHLGVHASEWDLLIIAVGRLDPIGPFVECSDSSWEYGVFVNALLPLRHIRTLYPLRNRKESHICLFAGGNPNHPLPYYSAYECSKTMLMRATECLHNELRDVNIFIIGPGRIKTKIHQQTLEAKERAGDNYERVKAYLESDDQGPFITRVYDCLKWCMQMGRDVVGGRNIFAPSSEWGALEPLHLDYDLWRLRRNEGESNK